MKIDMDIPDWAEDDSTVRIVSARELVAYKSPNEKWKVKKVRCARCGRCCLGGTCEQLEMIDGLAHCKLGLGMPFHCVVGIVNHADIPECKVEYEEIK